MITLAEERDDDDHDESSHHRFHHHHHSLPPLLIDERQEDDDGEAGTTTNLPLLTACYISALTTGATAYSFSFYSSDLKSIVQLSQNQIDTLSSATFVAGLVSWIPGIIVDRYGPRYAMIVGSVCNAILLTYYWLLVTQRIKLLFHYHNDNDDNNNSSSNNDLLIFVLSCISVLIFMGNALITGSVFKIIVESCTSSRGSNSSSNSISNNRLKHVMAIVR
jgi:MFS family permease